MTGTGSPLQPCAKCNRRARAELMRDLLRRFRIAQNNAKLWGFMPDLEGNSHTRYT